jgi:hypothetical protein
VKQLAFTRTCQTSRRRRWFLQPSTDPLDVHQRYVDVVNLVELGDVAGAVAVVSVDGIYHGGGWQPDPCVGRVAIERELSRTDGRRNTFNQIAENRAAETEITVAIEHTGTLFRDVGAEIGALEQDSVVCQRSDAVKRLAMHASARCGVFDLNLPLIPPVPTNDAIKTEAEPPPRQSA